MDAALPDGDCVPITPPSDLIHIFHLQPVTVDVLGPNGKVAYSLGAGFPDIETLSEDQPAIIARTSNSTESSTGSTT